MAGGSNSYFYRNLDSSDTTNNTLITPTTFPDASVISLWGWTNPGYVPKEWNTQRNGSGTSYALGASLSVQTSYFLIWEAEVVYTTTAGELTSIADAIRTKGGTQASLAYPAGFISAINDIPTGGGGNSGVEADYRGLSYAYVDNAGNFRRDTEKRYYMNAFRCAGGTKYIIFPPIETSHNRFRVAYYYNKSYSDFESYIEAAGEVGLIIYNADEHSTRDNAPYNSQPYAITPAQDGELMIGTDNQSLTAPAYLVQALT